MSHTFTNIRVNKICEKKLALKYPWIFVNEVTNPSSSISSNSGDIAYIYGIKNQFLGTGIIDLDSKICIRLLSKEKIINLDKNFFKVAISKAQSLRVKHYKSPFYRLVNYEGDFLGGLCIDRFDKIFILQLTTPATEHYLEEIKEAILDLYSPETIIIKTNKDQIVLGKEIKDTIIYENDIKFLANLISGQKTGYYYDQRENHKLIANIAEGKDLLDCFCYIGGFGIVSANNNLKSATFIDSSALALSYVKKNIHYNKLNFNYKIINDKAENALNKLAFENIKFDIVVLDPPPFIKNKTHKNKALKVYQKLAALALPLLNKNGYLFYSTCSHHINLKDLKKVCLSAGKKTRIDIKLIKTTGHPPDHPIHPALPESRYLNSVLYQIN